MKHTHRSSPRLSLALMAALAVMLPQVAPAQGAAKSAATGKAKVAQAKATKKKKPPTTRVARLAGVFLDQPQAPFGLEALLAGPDAKPKPFYDVVKKLDALATDADVKDVLIDLSGTAVLNAAQVAELDRCFGRIRKAGKRCHAYLENAGPVQVQVASMCDHILMADMGVLDIPSTAMSVMFLRDAMDMFGVKMDVVRCGDFKGAVEPFMLSSMSGHLRQHYLEMLKKINGDFVRRLAKRRNLTPAKVRKLQERRVFTARQALAAGLVDELVPWVGAKAGLKTALKRPDMTFEHVLRKTKKRQTLNFFSLVSTLLNPKKKGGDEKDMVVLHLSGAIMDGTREQPGYIISGPTVKLIRSLTKNSKVKGVVLRINSPGGSATASEAILLALRELAAQKPVTVSMGQLAASGGYYVACIGRPIFAEAGTITGSIGVFGMRPVLGPLMRRFGVKEELVALDSGPEMTSLEKPWSDAHRATVQTMVNEIYGRFVGHVSRSRQLSKDAVLKIAGGRVWSGEQAVAHGLVDRIGGLEDAMAVVAKEAGLKPGYAVTHLPHPKDPMTMLAEQLLQVKAILPPRVRAILGRRGRSLERALQVLVDAVGSERPTQVWAMMPEVLHLR